MISIENVDLSKRLTIQSNSNRPGGGAVSDRQSKDREKKLSLLALLSEIASAVTHQY